MKHILLLLVFLSISLPAHSRFVGEALPANTEPPVNNMGNETKNVKPVDSLTPYVHLLDIEVAPNLWGMFDLNSSTFIIEPVYRSLGRFQKNGLAFFEQNNKYGYINTQGQIVIPATYDRAYNFKYNGLAVVKNNGKYGVINAKGQIVIPATFDDVGDFSANGLAKVELSDKYQLKGVRP